MSHEAQRQFFLRVRTRFPHFFDHVLVLDCGSLDVNGSLREFFTDCRYIGVDIRAGRGVDVVSLVHDLPKRIWHGAQFDTVISANMLEHDQYWARSLRTMYNLLRPAGLMVVSVPSTRRPEHGTRRAPDSDGLSTGGDGLWGTSPDYYQGLEMDDFRTVFALNSEFATWELEDHQDEHPDVHDIFFYGIKR